MGHKKLAFKHRIAVNAFLSGMTKKEAMAEAGYSEKTCTATAHVFGREDVKHEIERRQNEVVEKYDIGQEWVVKRLVRIIDSSTVLSKFVKIDHEGKLYWNFTDATPQELALIEELAVETTPLGGHKIKVGPPSRQRAIDSLCRILGLNKDKLDLTGSVSLVERLQRGRGRVKKK